MDLSTLEIPPTCGEMIHTLDIYYHNFSRDMFRMSDLSINNFMNDYLESLEKLIDADTPKNAMRAAIGVLSLHWLGYRKFDQLTHFYDRLIPQKEEECVKFTSYIAGQLVHHPDTDQTHYVSHLFNRLVGWITGKGRRQRLLAASFLLCSLSENAGNSIILFIPTIKNTIWHLISQPFPKIIVLKSTAKAIALTTRSILRYGRSELESFLNFLSELCMRLLNFGNSLKCCAGLLVFKELVEISPDFFIKDFLEISELIRQSTSSPDCPDFLRMAAFTCAVSLASADPKQFVDIFSLTILDRAKQVLLNNPEDTVDGLCMLCQSVPNLMEDEINNIIMISNSLIRIKAYDAMFKLLETYLTVFPKQMDEFYQKNFDFLVSAPMSKAFKSFFVHVSTMSSTFDDNKKDKLVKLLEARLAINPVVTLKLISELSPNVFINQVSLFKLVTEQTISTNYRVRIWSPRAIFNLAKSFQDLDNNSLIRKLLAKATLEKNILVRYSFLKVVYDNLIKDFAAPCFLRYYKIFLNDESNKVRRITLKILAKLANFHPIAVTSITRVLLMEYFFIFQKIPSIRQQARTAQLLPYLVSASLNIAKTFSKSLIMVLENVLSPEYSMPTFHNFIEENSVTEIQIGVIKSLAILAPHDQDTVSQYIAVIIRLLCLHLHVHSNRSLVLAILQTLQILLSPQASTINIRTQSTEILAACSSLLAQTVSRKTRIAILKVVGTIGVLDVHQKPPPKSTESPQNVNDFLARQFFHPFRDADGVIDDSDLLKKSKVEQYNLSFVATCLLEIFQDDSFHDMFFDTANALTVVLMNPKMSYLEYFDSFVTRILDVIEQAQTFDQKKVYISIFSNLVSGSSNNISPFVPRALNIIKCHFDDELTIYTLDLILAFLEALENGFSPYTSDTVILLVNCLDNAKTRKKDVCRRVLEIFSILGQFATDFRSFIILQVCDAVVCEQTLPFVRTLSLETLRILVCKVDIFPHIGPIIRALKYGLSSNSQISAKQLAYALVMNCTTGSLLFARGGIPELDISKNQAMQLALPVVKNFVFFSKNLKNNKYELEPTQQNVSAGGKKKNSTKNGEKSHVFSEESVIARAVTPNLGLVRHLESWMNSLILTVITNSPSPSIRACQTVANASPSFARKLFRPAFASCWRELSESGRKIVTDSLHQLLLADERYDSVVRDVLNVFVFMDKIEEPLDIPTRDVINACIRYGCFTFALKLLERIEQPQQADVIKMIEVYLQLGNWSSAVAVWQKFLSSTMNGKAETQLFTQLRMWDRAEEPFREMYNRTKEPKYFTGLLETLSKLAKWNDMINFLPTFDLQKKHQKQQVSQFFAEASIHLGKWEDLDRVLDFSPIGSLECNMLNAMNALHKRDWVKVEQCFEHGFSLLASQPITFWEDEQKIHREMMLLSQQLIEIKEMERWLLSREERVKIENVWDARLKTAPRDFELWFEILGNRIMITEKRDKSLITFFQLNSMSLGTKIHTNAFEILFPHFDIQKSPDLDRLCFIVAQWHIGEEAAALEMIESLVNEIGPDLKMRANFLYALWLLESDDTMNMLKKAYTILKTTVKLMKRMQSPKAQTVSFGCLPIEMSPLSKHLSRAPSWRGGLLFSNHIMKNLVSDVVRVNVLRKWASVNSALIPLDFKNAVKYVNNAMTALNECIRLMPEFPDVAHLLNLFFEHANHGSVFEKSNAFISDLAPSLLLRAFPQILIQISHPSSQIAKFVHDLICNLLIDHYHGIIFSIHALGKSKIPSRARKATILLNEFKQSQPEIANEVNLIRVALLRAAVTWYEDSYAKLQESFTATDKKDKEQMIKWISSMFKEGFSEPKCEMHQMYQIEYGEFLQRLQQALSKYIEHPSQITYNTFIQIRQQMYDDIDANINRIKRIQLRSISEELCNKTSFHIAVPGTYKPETPLVKIQYFVGQIRVYQTKQQPKDVCIKGDDGNFYQYLLKGHEDLRLDERLMQFFKLINSLMKKETASNSQLIQTMAVIPLSLFHGLVQWVKGTDTIKAIVKQVRKLHNRPPMEEAELIEKLGGPQINDLLPIQRVQIIQKIFRMTPDTDISNFLWLKAENAEIWKKNTATFAISNAVMSIVGYIIGLGDRHPSNLLIDRFTGKVVHIDFGDSFEKAAKRSYKPEIVPFRLTRMMVRAMGITGVDGPFRSAFVNMSQLLRDNRRVLLMVLAIFVHEPLVDTDNLVEEQRVQCDIIEDTIGVCSLKRSKSISHCDKKANEKDSMLRSTSKSNFGFSGSRTWETDFDNDQDSNAEIRDRVKKKLTGRDYEEGEVLSVEEQATRLIQDATNIFNLAKLFSGWFPYW